MKTATKSGLEIEALARDLCSGFEDQYNPMVMVLVLLNVLASEKEKYDIDKLWEIYLEDNNSLYEIISGYYPYSKEPRVYVGRWDMLPKDWDQEMRSLYIKTEEQIAEQVCAQRMNLVDEDDGTSYSPFMLVNVYTLQEFEETFNNDLEKSLNTEKYWIKIFI